MPKDYSCRQIQQAQRGLFLRFLLSLVKDPDSLRSHASNNARIPWFHKRIKFKPQECSIISTTWMFSQYCDWKHDLGQFADGSVEEACARQYANPSGEQKSFTLFLRQNVLKRVGDSQRLKGQDTAEGMSEYFIVIPGGIETLDEALKEVPMCGEPCASCTYMSQNAIAVLSKSTFGSCCGQGASFRSAAPGMQLQLADIFICCRATINQQLALRSQKVILPTVIH